MASFIAVIIGYFLLINLDLKFYLIFLIFFIFVSFILCEAHIKLYNRKDPKEVVIDEFIGQSIPIYLYEISHGTEKSSDEAIIFYAVCFVLFRFFDYTLLLSQVQWAVILLLHLL